MARHCHKRASLKDERRRQAIGEHSNVINLLGYLSQLAVHDGQLLALSGDLAAYTSKADACSFHHIGDVRHSDRARRAASGRCRR